MKKKKKNKKTKKKNQPKQITQTYHISTFVRYLKVFPELRTLSHMPVTHPYHVSSPDFGTSALGATSIVPCKHRHVIKPYQCLVSKPYHPNHATSMPSNQFVMLATTLVGFRDGVRILHEQGLVYQPNFFYENPKQYPYSINKTSTTKKIQNNYSQYITLHFSKKIKISAFLHY